VVIPSPEEDQAINAAAKSDPDAQPLTHQQLQAMPPFDHCEGAQKSPHKKQLASIRYWLPSGIALKFLTISRALE
jgi:hypothetical protein